MEHYRVAVDIGGTFTDVYAFDDRNGEVIVTKTPSTPKNPEEGVIKGLEKINISGDRISLFTHGTTIGTNALIERKLPKTALITTKGFRDVTEIRRGTKLDLWDAYNDVAQPYIKRRDRYEINERINYEGTVLEEVSEDEVKVLAEIIRKKEFRSVAISFINSFVNGANEEKVKRILTEELPGVYICTSSEILPEIFEHERTSTTIINAVLGPIVSEYIDMLNNELKIKGYKGDLLVLHSGGGVMTSETVSRYAARISSSGTAAGAIASKHIANLCGFQNAMGLDMGGTSTDISLMYDNELRITKDWYIEYGYPIGFPSIELTTIGAGGGSLAWIDEGGSLRNGPHSAGADPGPVCYNTGGEEPTNTDANLVLGRLSRNLIDGSMSLDREKAAKAIQEKIGHNFGISVEEAACSIIDVANANMCDALQLISVRRGYDPRDFALVAFGGAGGLHAAYLAKEMEIPIVIIPPHPGVAAAMGCLLVDIRHDITETFVTDTRDVTTEELESRYSEMEKEAVSLLKEDGIPEKDMTLIRYIDMRYVGQWRTLTVSVDKQIQSLDEAIEKFHQLHEQEFAFSDKDKTVEIFGLQIAAIGTISKPEFIKATQMGELEDASKGKRDVYFKEFNDYAETPIYDRAVLPIKTPINGPAIVEQIDSTVLIPPNFEAELDEFNNMIIRLMG